MHEGSAPVRARPAPESTDAAKAGGPVLAMSLRAIHLKSHSRVSGPAEKHAEKHGGLPVCLRQCQQVPDRCEEPHGSWNDSHAAVRCRNQKAMFHWIQGRGFS